MTPRQDKDPLGAVPLTGTDSEQYLPALHRFLTRRLKNTEDVQDLAQETYLRFYQLANRQAIRSPSGYIFRIAVNLVYEFKLRGQRDSITYDSALADAVGEEVVDPVSIDPGDRLAAAEQLEQIVNRIPVTYRKVLLMHIRDGTSVRDIAAALKLTIPTVRVYLARALAFARTARWT